MGRMNASAAERGAAEANPTVGGFAADAFYMCALRRVGLGGPALRRRRVQPTL